MPSTVRDILRHRAVVVGALGYFVDIYDLVLFSIVRVASLTTLGVPPEQQLAVGVTLINWQMSGMLLGGVLWGILGDKKGRVSVLFGSILLYSLANIANAYVTSITAYSYLRFIAGIGLAGELGAAVTLVSESLPKETRGIGTGLVAGFGVSGAALAALIGAYCSWQTAFLVGGGLGLLLLGVRAKMHESAIFQQLRRGPEKRGDILHLLRSWPRCRRYLQCTLVGISTWFVVGILITFAPEICADLGATGTVSAGSGILYMYLGLTVGDVLSGVLSNHWRNRRRVVALFLAVTMALSAVFLLSRGGTPVYYYVLCFLLGIASGFWALFVTIAAEQFGTNLRATVATTAPNFVRAAVVPLTLGFRYLKPGYGTVGSCFVLGAVTFGLAFLGLWGLPETFGRDLDFIE